MKKLVSLILVSTPLFFFSCTHTETVSCTPGYATVYGIGFNSAELDSGQLTMYVADGLFDSVLTQASLYGTGYADTSIIYPSISPGFDYIIDLPSSGKQYRITQITTMGLFKETFTYTSGLSGQRSGQCFNGIKSYTINGTTYYVAQSGPSQGDVVIYLIK